MDLYVINFMSALVLSSLDVPGVLPEQNNRKKVNIMI